ncbi:MAG: penicillin-binding transpeptidase domain-containing protein [Candidatus Omnitrophota bacterium]|nr:penicillin-binding transpeptidase domain-containing protein [Candidatus Omnitrophota bacterium]
MYIKKHTLRFSAVFLFFIVALSLLLIKLVLIQIFRSEYLIKLAASQHNHFLELEPQRGTIYDRNLRPLALNLPAYSIYAVPREIKDKFIIIQKLRQFVNVDEGFLLERLSRKKAFVWLIRKLPLSTIEKIKSLKLEGIGFIKESKRHYPNSHLASQTIGFAGMDNVGLEGLELMYDKYLKGEFGWCFVLRDARQRELLLEKDNVPARDGFDIVLTIDETIQYIAERELDLAFKKHNARGATIIVMNPKTAEILALANRPTFDINKYNEAGLEERRNRAICDLFEPGSVFKIVTATAAIAEGKVSEEDRFFCENGKFQVANHILHDHRPHGWLKFREVIEQSSNIGTTKVAQILGAQIIYDYSKKFGFGQKTNIDLPGEISGMLKEPRFWSKTSIGAVPIGQEIGVNVLQLAVAISSIANDGLLMKPFIVRYIRDKQGEVIKEFSPVSIRQIMEPAIANRLKQILTGVIENGTGKLGQVLGYKAAGKTGTAQKLEPNGSYSHNKFFASFIGFVPVEDPKLAIVVIVDEPHPSYFGGTVCAPVFKRVAEDSLRYLEATSLKEFVKSDETKTYPAAIR